MALSDFFKKINKEQQRRKNGGFQSGLHLTSQVEKLEDRTLLSAVLGQAITDAEINVLTNDVDAAFLTSKGGALIIEPGQEFLSGEVANDVSGSGKAAAINITLDGNDPDLAGLKTIVIRDLTLNGNDNIGLNINLDNFTDLDSIIIENVTITGNGSYGLNISLDNVTGLDSIQILSSNITGNGGVGVNITAENGSEINSLDIDGTSIVNNTGPGLCILADTSTINNSRIKNNTITGNTGGDGIELGMVDSSAQVFEITNGNVISNNGGNGILFNLVDSELSGLLIDDSTINANTAGSGIHFDGNITVDDTTKAIEGSITNNTITNHASGHGIEVTPGSSAENGVYNIDINELSDNVITGNRQSGIFVETPFGTSFDANVVRNNISNNNSFGFALTVIDAPDAFDLTFGSSDPADGNIFNNNRGAGLAFNLNDTTGDLGNTTGSFRILNNQITNTRNDLAGSAVFNGQGIVLRLFGTDVLTNGTGRLFDSTIDGNTITDNDSIGIDIEATEDSIIDNLLIGNAHDGNNNNGNTISNNSGHGIMFVRKDNAAIDNIRIIDNVINANTSSGNGVEIVVQNSLDLNDFLIEDNEITNNRYGVRLETRADAIIKADIIGNDISSNALSGIRLDNVEGTGTDAEHISGTWIKNTINSNGSHGIHIPDGRVVNGGVTNQGTAFPIIIGQTGTDSNGRTLGNEFTNNGGNGILFAGVGGASIVNNLIRLNNGGINIDVSTTLGNASTGVHTFEILDNFILSNTGIGVDIDQSIGARFYRIHNNIITLNTGDGLEFRNQSWARLTAVQNTIDLNGGRGIDFLNHGSGDTHAQFGGGVTEIERLTNRNNVRSNSMEGVYVVNMASTNPSPQTASSTANLPLGSTGARPNLVFDFDTNEIKQNGQNSPNTTTGLVFRVGTALSAGDNAWNVTPDITGTAPLTTGFPPSPNIPSVIGVGNLDINGPTAPSNARVNARVVGNEFDGNFGDDVLFESENSATPGTGVDWDRGGTGGAIRFNDAGYETDPLARLNLEFHDNTGDSLDVSRTAASLSTNDNEFKSRTNNKSGLEPDGPYTSGTRSRSGQIVQGDGSAGSHAAPNQQTTPARSGGISGASFAASTNITITTSSNHGLTGGYVTIRNVLGNTNANGTWSIISIPAPNKFTIARVGNATYVSSSSDQWTNSMFGTGFLDDSVRHVGEFLYPAQGGANTFRVEDNWSDGTNQFITGDDFSGGWDEITAGLINHSSYKIADLPDINEGDGTATFTVRLSEVDTTDTVIGYTIYNGTAQNLRTSIGIDEIRQTSTGVLIRTGIDNTTGHNLATGNLVTIAGVDDRVNGEHSITIIDDNWFILDNVAIPLIELPRLPFAAGSWSIIDNDFTNALTGSVTISAGSQTGTFSIPINDDDIYEGTEQFTVLLNAYSNSANAAAVDNLAIGTIIDNDTGSVLQPLPELIIEDGAVIKITSAAHGLETGDVITIQDVSIDNKFNDTFTITRIDNDTFSLDGTVGLSDGEDITDGIWFETPGVTAAITDAVTAPGADVGIESVGHGLSGGETVTIQGVSIDNKFNGTFTISVVDVDNFTLDGTTGLGANEVVTDGEWFETPIVTDNIIAADTGTHVEGDIGTTEFTFTVTLSDPSDEVVTVEYNTLEIPAEATSGVDFRAETGTLYFNPGDPLTQEITISVIGDISVEADEVFSVELNNAFNAAITTSSANSTIEDDDVDVTPVISITDNKTIIEGDVGVSSAIFTVSLDQATGNIVTVDLDIVDGAVRANIENATQSATEGEDYDSSATSTTLTFLPGQTSKTVRIDILADTLNEYNEDFFINLLNPTNATISGTEGVGEGLILDDDGLTAPTISIEDVSVDEDATGNTTTATFRVFLSAASGKTITVGYATDESETAGDETPDASPNVTNDDFESKSGTLTFNPEVTEQFITVTITGDDYDEFDETFLVNLSGDVNADSILDATGQGKIIDDNATDADDEAVLNISDPAAPVNEGVSAEFTVTLNAISGKPVSVQYQTVDGSATIINNVGGTPDYGTASNTLNFAEGETSKTITITTNSDFPLDEFDEIFFVDLSSPMFATIGDNEGEATILDVDDLPMVSINDQPKLEGDTGTTIMSFTVSLTNASEKTINVGYYTEDITAQGNVDYIPVSGTLTFLPGDTSLPINVPIIGDLLDEFDEDFRIVLFDPMPGPAPAPPSFHNGIWNPEGPFSTLNGQVENIQGGNAVVGAIHTVAAHPVNADRLYIGATNGGIWRTDNAQAANPDWTPLTDDMPSLSIGALEFDPANPDNMVAGIGRFSSFGLRGGSLTGLMTTTDGGDSWTQITHPLLTGRNITGVALRGNTILVTSNNFSGGTGGGVYRSTDSGANWTLISGSNGLTAGASFDLVGDPTNADRFYASIQSVGIFQSNNAGASWTNISANDASGVEAAIQASGNNNTEMAVASNGRLYVGVLNNGRPNYIGFTNNGTSWTTMDLPQTNESNGDTEGLSPREKPGGQGSIHFSIVVDPVDPNTVYVAGDRQDTPFPNFIGATNYTGRIFRGDTTVTATGAVPSPQWEHMTHRDDIAQIPEGGTANSSSPHADSREMTFDANGILIEVDDGGIYKRTSPQDNTGDWFSLNGNLQVTEFHDISYDSVSNTLIGGAQDTGTPEQAPNGIWNSVSTADGGDVAVDDITLAGSNQSIHYSSFQNLGAFRRRVLNSDGSLVSQVFPALTVTGGGAAFVPQFATPFVLNEVNPTRMIFGGANSVYESLDQGDTIVEIGAGIPVNGTSIKPIAYGGTINGTPNEDVLYVGSGSSVYIRTTSGGTLTASASFPGGTVTDIELDPNDWMTAYVSTVSGVFQTIDAGNSWTDITGDLSGFGAGVNWTLEFVEGVDDDILLVGTGVGVFQALGADGFTDWEQTGSDLPTVIVMDMEYDAVADIVAVGTLGRGAWTVSNASITLTANSTAASGDLNAIIDDGEGNGKILDDDGEVSISIDDIDIDPEGSGAVPTFGPVTPIDIAVGRTTQAVTVFDFNGDGFDDIASANQDSNSVSVLISNGDGTFQAAVNYAVETGPRDIIVGDFDSDNETDIAVSNWNGSSVSILLSNGDGTFQPAMSTPVGILPRTIAAGDINNDNKLDLAVSSSVGGEGHVLLGNDDGTFQAPIVIPNGGFVALGLGHLNADSNLDLVLSTGSVVEVRMGNGDGTFGSAQTLSNVGTVATNVTVVDIDGDSFNDIIIPKASGVEIHYGDGAGNFTSSFITATSIFWELVVTDLDVDGDLDIAFGKSGGDNGVGYLINDGIGTRTFTQFLSGGPAIRTAYDVFSGDFDNDGNPDLVTANNILDNVGVIFNAAQLAGTPNSTWEFTVKLSAVSAKEVRVNFATNDISAEDETGDNDYTAFSGTLIFAPGETQKKVAIEIVGDKRDEFNENFTVDLDIPINATISDGQGIGLIVDDDNPSSITIHDAVPVDEETAAEFKVVLDRPSGKVVQVNFSTVDGTATVVNNIGGTPDYQSQNNTLVFAPGQTEKTITITTNSDSPLDEFDENFFIDLSSPVAVIIADGRGEAVILDVDPEPIINIGNQTLIEGNSGLKDMVFDVTLSAASEKPITFGYALQNGTAVAGRDFIFSSGLITFNPGDTLKQVVVPIIGELKNEIHEDFQVVLFDPAVGPPAPPFVDPGPGGPIPTVGPHQLIAGVGGGSLTVGVDGFGAFGSSVGFDSSDAIYDPIGPQNPAGTVFESGVAIRIGDTGTRQFLTSGTIGVVGSTGGLTNPNVTGSINNSNSAFTFNGLDFGLSQSLNSRFNENGVLAGSTLTQTYVITNSTSDPIDFELIRYVDGDLLFDGGGVIGTPGTGNEILFETDAGGAADTDTTFFGINAIGGTIPATNRFELDEYFDLVDAINAGTDLDDGIFNDGDGDSFVDVGSEYDITLALKNLFALAPGESVTYVTNTLWGSGSPEDVGDLTSSLNAVIGDGVGDGLIINDDDVPTVSINNVVFDPEAGLGLPTVFDNSILGPATTINTENGPDIVRIADFNGDTIPDIAVVSSLNDTLDVHLGNGDGTFAAATSFAVGSNPRGIAIADLNDDTFLDIVVTNDISDDVSVLLGDGAGDFAAAVNYTVGDRPDFVTLVDVDGDTFLDIVTANKGSNDITVLPGIGDGTFGTAITHAVGTTPTHIVSGDFDADGDTDLAVSNSGSDDVSILLRDTASGNNQFDPAVSVAVGVNPQAIAIGDIDGLNGLDLIVANGSDNNVSVLMNDSKGVFTAGTPVATAASPFDVQLVDMNRDTALDLIVASNTTGILSVSLNDGFGNFAAPFNFGVGSGTRSFAVADLNGDGHKDIVASNFDDDTLSVLMNNTPPNTLTFTVTLSAASGQTIKVDYATEDGNVLYESAEAALDYLETTGQLTFLEDETTKTIEVPILDDLFDEFNERFFLNLITPVNVDLADAQGEATIVDDDELPTLNISDIVIDPEGDFGLTEVTFTITMSQASGKPVMVDYATEEISSSQPSGGSGQNLGMIDMFLLFDDTGSFSGAAPSTINAFPTIIANMQQDFPTSTLSFGVGRFEEYLTNQDALPFILNQPLIETTVTDFDLAIDAALNRFSPSNGGSPAESAFEGLYQIATGAGFDGNDDGSNNENGPAGPFITQTQGAGSSGDVPPFSSFTEDLTGDPAGPIITSSGTEGGVGWRTGSTRIVILASDAFQGFDFNPDNIDPYVGINGLTLPAADLQGTGSVTAPSNGAEIQETINALLAEGILVVGLGTDSSPFSPLRTQMESISTLTGAINNSSQSLDSGIPSDPIDPGDPLYFVIDQSSGDTISDAISAALQGLFINTNSGDGVDYLGETGTVFFDPIANTGTTSETITISIVGDQIDEVDEEFLINLFNAKHANINVDQAKGLIIDDDGPPEINISDVTVTEGGFAEFTVSLNLPNGDPITSGKVVQVSYSTQDNTAKATVLDPFNANNVDYLTSGGIVTFSPGDTEKKFSIPIFLDGLDEFEETFFVNLSSAVNGTIADDQGIGTIIDIDAPARMWVNDPVFEPEGHSGSRAVTFTVNLMEPSGKTVTVDYSTSDNSAVAGLDYVTTTGTNLTFLPGELSKTVEVLILGDVLRENDETFFLDLSNESNATVINRNGVATIIDDDRTPTVSINDVSLAEGDSGITSFDFTVSLSEVSGQTITVAYTTMNDTAIAGDDYASKSGVLTFAPGETTKTVTIDVNGDELNEGDDTFKVRLINPVNVNFSDDIGLGTILNDDPLPTVSINDIVIDPEEDPNGADVSQLGRFTVTLSEPSGRQVSVDYFTVDFTPLSGTTTPGADYNPQVGTLTFAPGETEKVIDITIFKDTLNELDETLFVNISNPVNVLITDQVGQATIIDDDPIIPGITIDDVVISPSINGPDVAATFTVSIDLVSGQEVTVDFATSNGSATAGEDYVATTGTVTFAPGETSKTISVTVLGMTLNEVDEDFFIDLSNATNANLLDNQGRGEIGGDTISIFGTNNNDEFVFVSGEADGLHQVTINGVPQTPFDASRYLFINIFGLDGNDSLDLTDSSADEKATLKPGRLNLSHPESSNNAGDDYRISAGSFEQIAVTSGGGEDEADFRDSIGDDMFIGRADNSQISGDGFFNSVAGYSRVLARATSGNDRAKLFDSAGNDKLLGRPDFAFLSGPGFLNYAGGFDRVDAYSQNGGRDKARLQDSSTGDDTFVAMPDIAGLHGSGYNIIARNFDLVDAIASGGNDEAKFEDSAGKDKFRGTPDYSLLVGAGFLNLARNFDEVTVTSSHGGDDKATFEDSAGDDSFIASPDFALMAGAGFRNLAIGFAEVEAFADNGGTDKALLKDSAGNDLFVGFPEIAVMSGAGYRNAVNRFDEVEGRSSTGNDRAKFFDSTGDDTFVARPDIAWLQGSNFLNIAKGFPKVEADSSSGGNDVARFSGSVGNDNFASTTAFDRLRGTDYENIAYGFLNVELLAGQGGTDKAVFHEVQTLDSVFGRNNQFSLTRSSSGRQITVTDVEEVTAIAGPNQFPFADVSSIDYIFEKQGNWLE